MSDPCIAGCGFYGKPETMGLCSQCYKIQTGAPLGNSRGGSTGQRPRPAGEGQPAVESRSIRLPNSDITLKVLMGDMTTENVDAIVNAANEKLDHVSGLAGSIVKKGGEIIQVESDNLIWERRSMPLEEGDVAVTTAGRLPAKHVIHAVGPVWHGGKNGEEVILHLAVSNVLSKAEEMKLASVSIPAISSGIFGFPKPLCCQIVIDAICEFIATHKPKTLQQVRLTNFDEETCHLMNIAFDTKFPPAAVPAQPVAPVVVAPPAAPPGPINPTEPTIDPIQFRTLAIANVEEHEEMK